MQSQRTDLLAGKVALVTGASRGIGRAIALAFARNGAEVAVTARDTSRLEPVTSDLHSLRAGAHAISADFEDPEATEHVIEETLSAFGRIDILVNNAALIHPPLDLIDFDPDEVTRRRDALDANAIQSTLEWISDAELTALMERLPLAQQQVLLLRYLVDLTTADIAEVLGRKAESVRQLEHRARAQAAVEVAVDVGLRDSLEDAACDSHGGAVGGRRAGAGRVSARRPSSTSWGMASDTK